MSTNLILRSASGGMRSKFCISAYSHVGLYYVIELFKQIQIWKTNKQLTERSRGFNKKVV